ncbi:MULTISPECIES: PQQ-binding-like beta-propeller repeat protein [Paenibacillus]|uniref:PQQ-binding-like beta-propeller repeat protein n=1 Tax=Paenibacillus TaxID=44249 RepID=UPI0003E22AA6|nr:MULTISPECIES: PQQ-binding-like beta-propeller repeat protein [Paenibacillus]ETT43286.1 cell surface protein [Paenibacillus sp. FSL R5-808]
MRIKKSLTVLTAFTLLFSFMTSNVNAASTPFSQGAGYHQGAYDKEAMQPIGHNWNRNSRFAAVNSNVHLKWKYQMPSGGNSSIVISKDGTIFTKNYESSSNPKFNIYSINPDGTLKWKQPIIDSLVYGTPIINSNNKLIIPAGSKLLSLNIDDGAVTEMSLPTSYSNEVVIGSDGTYYLSGIAGRLAAYNPSGTPKWISSFESSYHSGYPALTDQGSLVFKAGYGSYGSLYSFNSQTGQLNWEFKGIIGSETRSAPAIAKDGTIYVTSQDGFVYAINPDGTQKWKVSVERNLSSTNVIDPIVGPDGTIYSVNGTKDFYAINPDGTIKWIYNSTAMYSSPIIDKNNIVYIGVGGKVVALNANGVEQWSLALNASNFISASAIAEDGTLYIADSSGTVFAIGGEVTGPTDPTEPPVEPKPPVDPVGERAIFVLTLSNGTEKEYDLSMQEVQQFISWYEARAAGNGPVTFAINKHNNNKGPFKQRQDYIVYDKIITFEVNEY